MEQQKKDVERQSKLSQTDSFYADGVWMLKAKASVMEEAYDFTGKASKLMESMVEAGVMTQTAAAVALQCGRHEASGAARSLWFSGMMDIYNVFSRDVNGVNAQFQLWVVKGCQPPADAREACRLAVLGLFYGHAKIEVPGFGWRLIRRAGRPVMAEVGFVHKDGEAVKWLVDAPRLGEEPNPEADLFVFPSAAGGREEVPADKMFTWDLAVINARPGELRRATHVKKKS